MTSGTACAKGAISIVNAIPSGKGATVSVSLPTSARVSMIEQGGRWHTFHNGKEGKSVLALASVREAIQMLGKDPRSYSGSVETESPVPIGVGLKSSSSASVAIVLAVCDALGEDKPRNSEIMNCSVRSSLSAGVSLTGAMDDAASCLLGGINFVDNTSRRALSRREVGEALKVVIRVPGERSRRLNVDAAHVRKFSSVADTLFNLADGGEPWKAMTLNGLMCSSIYGYDTTDALEAIEAGAVAAGLSGTGPAVAAVFKEEVMARQLADDWEKGRAKVVMTETSDGRATIGA